MTTSAPALRIASPTFCTSHSFAPRRFLALEVHGRSCRRPCPNLSVRHQSRQHARSDSRVTLSRSPPPSHAAPPRAATWAPRALPQDAAQAQMDPEEEDKFVELQGEMEAYGPPVLLLLGLTAQDKARVRAALDRCGARFIATSFITKAMMDGASLWDAMQAAASPGHSDADVAPTPQILLPGSVSGSGPSAVVSEAGLCIMSGVNGEEVMELVTILEAELPHLGATGLAFAAMRPNFAQRKLSEVVTDILGDHHDCNS